jgi:hypothetical protein
VLETVATLLSAIAIKVAGPLTVEDFLVTTALTIGGSNFSKSLQMQSKWPVSA